MGDKETYFAWQSTAKRAAVATLLEAIERFRERIGFQPRSLLCHPDTLPALTEKEAAAVIETVGIEVLPASTLVPRDTIYLR